MLWAAAARASWRRDKISSTGIKSGSNLDLHDEDTESDHTAAGSKRYVSLICFSHNVLVSSAHLEAKEMCMHASDSFPTACFCRGHHGMRLLNLELMYVCVCVCV